MVITTEVNLPSTAVGAGVVMDSARYQPNCGTHNIIGHGKVMSHIHQLAVWLECMEYPDKLGGSSKVRVLANSQGFKQIPCNWDSQGLWCFRMW